MNCYLISEEALRRYLPRINANVPFADLEAAFRLVHDLDTRPLLGDAVWAELCARKADETLTALDVELLEKAEPFLAWSILARYLEGQPSLRLDPQGVLTRTNEEISHADAAQLNRLLSSTQAYARQYRGRFAEWLRANAASYPNLPPPDNCHDRPFLGMITGSAP